MFSLLFGISATDFATSAAVRRAIVALRAE
jgi:hypothetical protein